MKVLVTSTNNGEEKTVTYAQMLSAETDNIKHELVEVEDLPEKKGYSKELMYDKDLKKYKFEYRELPLTEEEKMNEEIIKLKQALVDLSAKNIKAKDFENIPEDAGLSSADLAELDKLEI